MLHRKTSGTGTKIELLFYDNFNFCVITFRENCNASSVGEPNRLHIDPDVIRYKCPVGVSVAYENYTWTNASYNESMSLSTLSYISCLSVGSFIIRFQN